MTYIKIDGNEYEAKVKSIPMDTHWDNRLAKLLYPIGMTVAECIALFHDDLEWSIVETRMEYNPETEEEEEIREEFDMSEYDVLGEIVQYNDRTVSVEMGKTTELEEAYELLYGGNDK